MRTTLILTIAFCLLVLPAAAQSVCSPQTTNSCTTQTIGGDWGVTCDGYLNNQPTRILGTCNGTPGGIFTCEATAMVGGVPATQTLTGRAIVNANCTGTIRYSQKINGSPAGDLNIRFLILENGNRIKGLVVDPGAVLSCVLDRMGLRTPPFGIPTDGLPLD